MPKRIAFASSDGEFVDMHFGQADTFYVYDFDEAGESFIEERNSLPMSGHSESDFPRLYGLFSDCDAVVAMKIGFPVAAYLMRQGIRIFESQFAIIDVLQKLREEIFQSDNSPITR